MGPKKLEWQEKKSEDRKSYKEFSLQAVGFRTYEPSLLEVLQKPDHAKFMAMIGLTEFLALSWSHTHKELAVEFLKNYKKKQTPRISLSSTVRSTKITLTKQLIASTFHLSSTGYKAKNNPNRNDGISLLFDRVTARRNGYYIRDCKDPTYFERLEALNRLICFKPPGQLISELLVDVMVRAAIQHVDWAGLLMITFTKELDRVSSSLPQCPSTPVGVHIFLILTNLNIITAEDLQTLTSNPYILLDSYSTTPSLRSSPSSSLPVSPRSVQSQEGLAKILHLKKGEEKSSRSEPPFRTDQNPKKAPVTSKSGRKPLTSKGSPGVRQSEVEDANRRPGERLAKILGTKDVFVLSVDPASSSTTPSQPVHKRPKKVHCSIEGRAPACWQQVLQGLRRCVCPS